MHWGFDSDWLAVVLAESRNEFAGRSLIYCSLHVHGWRKPVGGISHSRRPLTLPEILSV